MKYFNKNELIRCYRQDKAQRCKECRLPQPATRLPNGIEESLTALVENVLDPVREALGRPIVVNSGFRCPVHNRVVGGATVSQHVKGEAADVTSERGKFGSTEAWKRANLEIARAIVKLGKWDQMILENTGENDLLPVWIHVSWKRTGLNRKEILKKVDGRNGYVRVRIEELINNR